MAEIGEVILSNRHIQLAPHAYESTLENLPTKGAANDRDVPVSGAEGELKSTAPPISYEESNLIESQKTAFKIEFNHEGVPNIQNFVGRTRDLEEMEEYIFEKPMRRKVLVLWATPGFGKTQLAVAFATKWAEQFTSIFFIQGENKETLNQSMSRALDQIWEKWSTASGRPQNKPPKSDAINELVLKWLAISQNQRWLVIFDSVDETKDYEIADFIPNGQHGSIIITTREESYSALGKCKFVDKMSYEDASELFHQAETLELTLTPAVIPNEEDPGRKALLEWIDGCPIAIESVGTRIKNTGIGYEKLLTTLKEGTGIQGVLNSKLISIYRDALTQLLECEDQTRQKLYSQAGKLLLVFSYLDPRDLWHGILERAQIDPDAPEWFRSVANSEAEFERVIKVLLSHSLLRVDRKKAEVFTMHNVVREACHLFAETQGPNEYLAIAVGCVAYSDVSDFHLKEREIRARLSPHADAILKPLVSHYDQDKISIRGFLYSSASQKHQDLIYKIFDSDKDDKSDKYLGYFHPVMRLAFLFIWSNKYENASQVCSAAITNLSRSTLKDDYALASLKACHALLLYRQKRYDEAMPVAIETHDLTCRLFTLNSREGLWTWRIIAALKRKLPGGEMEAIEIGEKTIEMSAILCGKDSENYIWAVSDNAFTFLDLDLPQARDLYVEAFLKTRELLGSDHLETIYAAAHINLKSMEESTKFEQRIFFARKAWEGFSIALGEGADDTLNQAKQLAWFYGEEEDFEHCAEIRRIIVREMKRRSYESDEDRLDFCRNYKSLADSLIRIWEDNEFLEESLDSSQTNIPASDEAENIKKPDSSNNGDQPRVQTESHSEPTAGENVQIEGKRAKTNEQEVTEEQKDQAGTTTNDPGADSQSKSSTLETEILACLSEALAITKSLNKDPDKSVLVTQFGIALAYTRVLRHNHAVEIIQGVLESYRQMKESVPNEIRVILSTLAETYYDAGEEAKVNNTLFEILQMPDDSSTDEQRAKVAESNAQICVKCRKYGLALPLLQKSYDISRHTLHSGNVDSMQTGLDYADCLKECGDLAEAEKVNNEVQVALEQVRDSEDKDILRLRCYSKYCLAFIKDHLNDEKSAHELFVEARHMYQELAKVDQSAYQMISDLNSIIGQLYLDQGKHDEAMSDFQKVVDLRAKYPKQISRQRECCAFYFMGRVKYDESKLEDAISYCLKARRYFLRNPTDPYDGDYLRQSEWLLVLCYFRCQQLGRLVSLVCEITQAPHNSYSDQYIFLCIAGFLGCSGNLEVAIALSLAVLKDCKAIFGVKNWRSLSALRMLKAFQIMHDELETYGKSILQYSLVASLEKTWACGFLTPDEVDILWIESEPISKTSPDHLLCGEEWEIPLLCGDSAHLLPELPAAFQKVLQYNNPPEGKIWPRSWTFWVDALQNNEYQAIPLWIAGAPVIIPLETRYPLSPALVPPADPHPPIAIGDFLSSDVIKLIFDCYDFADGFNVLWNGQLQIFVDQKFDFISALTEKPRTFGGLQVDYVSPSLVPSKFNCFHIRLDSLLPFSSTLRLNDNLSAATRSTRNAAFKPQGKLGLVVQSKGSNEKFATICSHVISKALEKRISGQVNPRVLRKAPSIREFRDKITIYAGDRFDDNKEKRVGRVHHIYDDNPCGNPPWTQYTYDLALVKMDNSKFVESTTAPIPQLGWHEGGTSAWQSLRGEFGSQVKLIGGNVGPSDIITNVKPFHAQVVGESVTKQNPSQNNNSILNRVGNQEIATSVSRCLLFRAPQRVEPDGQSGRAIYKDLAPRSDGSVGPAVVGFISFYQGPKRDLNIATNMEDNAFRDLLRKGKITYWAAYPLPDGLVKGYDIVSCKESEANVSDDTGTLNAQAPNITSNAALAADNIIASSSGVRHATQARDESQNLPVQSQPTTNGLSQILPTKNPPALQLDIPTTISIVPSVQDFSQVIQAEPQQRVFSESPTKYSETPQEVVPSVSHRVLTTSTMPDSKKPQRQDSMVERSVQRILQSGQLDTPRSIESEPRIIPIRRQTVS